MSNNAMTPQQQQDFIEAITPGVIISGYGGQEMVVTSIDAKRIRGYSKYAFDKFSKKVEVLLSFATIRNPHYNKNLSIKAAN